MDPKDLTNAAGKPASLKMADTGPSVEEMEDAAMDSLLDGNAPGESEQPEQRGQTLQDGLMAAARAADQQHQTQQEIEEPPPATELSMGEQMFLSRSGYSAEQVETIRGMSPEQRAILWSKLETPGGFQNQQPQFGQPNPYLSQQQPWQSQQQPWQSQPQFYPSQNAPQPQFRTQGQQPVTWNQQPQFTQQQGYQPQQQPGYPQVDQRQLQSLADQMGVDAAALQGLTQFQLDQAAARFQQHQQQNDQRFEQMQQQFERVQAAQREQHVTRSMDEAFQAITQRYPQFGTRGDFDRLVLDRTVAAQARYMEENFGVPLSQALAATVEQMVAPQMNQQMGRTTQQQLHQNARRARNTAERTPQVGRAPAPPALREGRDGVDDYVDQLLRQGAFDQRAG
ncbi:MAG: hypothetical protein ACIAQU_04345 [Phycisphaerales bacterium JB064]